MPTEPVDDFLKRDRDEDETELYQILEKFASGIEETVNYGTVIFKWCNESLKGENDKNVPVLLLFRHSLELCDSISILIRKSSIDPCKTHLRALFEAITSALYLLEENHERRAYAFLVCRTHKKIKQYKSLDPNTELGKQFKGKMKGTVLNDLQIPGQFDIEKIINSQENLLNKDGYKQANQEYRRLKKERKKTPKWFQFYGGPGSLEQMAIKLGKVAEYEIFYRNWSEYIHSTEVISDNLQLDEGQTYIAALRQPFNAQFVTSTTLTFAFKLYKKMIEHFVPNNITHYRIWRSENINSFYKEVTSRNRIIKRV